MGTRLGTNFHDDDFWETVIRWLIEHPEIEPVHHGPIIDYVNDQKFVPSVPSGLGRGRRRLVVPHPSLCMRGRTAGSLLRAVERWHRQLGSRTGAFASWQTSGIPPFRMEEIDGFCRRVYAITELISSAELEEEGAAMSHCVATYGAKCLSGDCSIWSLTAEDERERVHRLLTLEVHNRARTIVQARGKFNRVPNTDEIRILTLWSGKEGARLSEGVVSLMEWHVDQGPANEENGGAEA